MNIIKLSQQCTVEKQGKHGWEPETVFEPIYIFVEHIETLAPAGITYIKMRSGERIQVKETPEEIISLIKGEASDGEVNFWSNLGVMA